MMNKGQKIYDLAGRLFPICRSITGAGVRETLGILSGYISEGAGEGLTIYNVPSGTQAFDWTVPKEWAIRAAYIEDETGRRIVDFAENNLHVMGYSLPVDQWVDLAELKTHIFSLPEQPDVIPYVTSYYEGRFGFCMSDAQKNALRPGKYHMYIDSALFDGNLTYGEIVLPGKSDKEIFFSTYICHPSMADNECSGPALMAELVRYVRALADRRYTYRFLFIPETIGSITYLSQNLAHMKRHMLAGFNLSCVGDNNGYSMVHTRYGNTLADRALGNILSFKENYTVYSFLQRGSDERQYNAPGVDLPVVCFCRSKFGEYKEYHTSADNMEFVSPEGFAGSFEVMTQLVEGMEGNVRYCTKVLCEPQLGKRALYPTISQKGGYNAARMIPNFIAYADGRNDLFAISDLIQVPTNELLDIIKTLKAHGLLYEAPDGDGGGICPIP